MKRARPDSPPVHAEHGFAMTRGGVRGGVKMQGRPILFTPTPGPSPQGGGERMRLVHNSTFSESGY